MNVYTCLIFLNIIISSISVLPIWNFKNSTINLLTSDSYNYEILDRVMYDLKAKLIKYITRDTSGKITHSNKLFIDDVDKGTVSFENIESFYKKDENVKYICPYGKFHPINAKDMSTITNTNFENTNNWNLKCYNHNVGFFFTFYMENGQNQTYNLRYTTNDGTVSFTFDKMTYYQFENELYDFKLVNKENNIELNDYPFMAIVKSGNNITFYATKLKLTSTDKNLYDPITKVLMEAKTYIQANFDNSTNHFYYFTYNNVSDFSCGHSTTTNTNNDFYTTSSIVVVNNYTSPFEFVDDVEIKEMKFILYTKYAYYEIYNKKENKTYHGVVDITLNKVIFNTDEDLDVFIPYSTNSMLAINGDSAYRICFIRDSSNSTNCLDSCSSNNLLLDVDGNKCSNNCDENQLILLPEEVCISPSDCNSLIYVIKDSKCGLCRDLEEDKKYKILNGTECLDEIPDGAEVYNQELYLLACQSGYILEENACVPHCYNTCDTCFDYSTDSTDQKCKTCIQGYYLNNETLNCLEILPTTIPTTIVTTIPTTIFTTIPTTIVTTIPTTIFTTIPTTIVTTIPTTIFTTIPTTIVTTIPTTIFTTIPTTIPTTIVTTIPTTIPEVECIEETKTKCSKCDDESNELKLCVSCNEGFKNVYYHEKYIDCLAPDDPILKKNFYHNETSDEYVACYKTCNKCSRVGDIEGHYCLECISGYMFRPGENPKNNCVVYSEYYYLNPYNQYKPMDSLQCPEESKYIIKKKKSCIDDCSKDPEYKYLYNGRCEKQCPDGTSHDVGSYLCKADSNVCTLGDKKNLYLKNNSLDIIDTLVRTYISEFNYTNKFISYYQNELYTIIIYKDTNCLKEVDADIPKVDFKSCYTKVQNYYNITEDLIISIVDRTELSNPLTFYSFFHPVTGRILNATEVCKDDIIEVEENLDDMLDENHTYYDVQKDLTDQGVNIFDPNDPFYTDLCYDFDNPLERDIPLNSRIEYFFPNVSVCDEGCEISGINLENMTAVCNCFFKDITSNSILGDLISDSAVGQIFDLINSSNLLVLKCVKYMFNNFATSIGGWISLVLIAGQIAMTLLYFLFELSKLKIGIYSLAKRYLAYISNLAKSNISYPPKRNISQSRGRNIKDNNKRGNNNKSVDIFKSKDFDVKSDKIKLVDKKLDKNIISETKKINSDKKLYHIKINTNEKSDKNDNKKKSQNNDSELSIDIKATSEDNDFFKDYLSTSPDEMEYDDAIHFEKRTFSEHFLETLKEKQITAHTFISDDILKPKSMKIIVFILTVLFYFVVNGLLFSEDVIQELFDIDESEENFFSFFTRSISRIIYSSLVAIVIGIITDLFFIEERRLKLIFIRGKKDKFIIKKNILDLINDIKKRNIAFIIISSVLLIIGFFYLLCFNYVYPYSQIEWIKSSITIVIIMQILSLLKCLLESGLRYLSFKCKSEKIYKVGKLLD